MALPFGVIAIYVALAAWAVILIRDLRRGSFGPFIWVGIALLLILNIRYFIEGAPDAIAFFIGIYDVLDNLGVSATDGAAALAPCPDNACTVWGDRFVNHPSWGVAFHDRFLNGSNFRNSLLYVHLGLNSIVFVLMHIQLARTGASEHKTLHKLLGRVSFTCLTLATVSAVWLASQHGNVSEYGGNLSVYGFWFMSFCVYGCAVLGVIAIRRGDAASHRIWMIRFVGSMWGAFWIFRAMLLVTGPLMRNWESASILTCIWLSAPLGILIAELCRIQLDRKKAKLSATTFSVLEK
ncbi:MAG: DUF2306 domain-containing protein [Sneathiella sp.]